MVHVSGKMKSNHTTKQAAKNAARDYASDGDTLEIRRTDGSIQKRVTVQKASSGSESDESGGFGIPGFGNKDYGKGTMEVNDLF
jgi:hypothetical protein